VEDRSTDGDVNDTDDTGMLESGCSVIMVVNVIILVCDVGGVTDVALDDVNDVLVVSVTSDDGVGTCVNDVGVNSVVAVDGGTLVIVVLTPDVVIGVDSKTDEEVAVVTDTGVTIVGAVVRT
jgi:hypothetical protein